jgi:hypothetical protein
MKSTNYLDTFIAVADDCPVERAMVPQLKGDQRTVALLQFEMIHGHPYTYTSDEVLFTIHALRNGMSPTDLQEREAYFLKGRACFRASPLGKRFGWGIHHDGAGKMALYPMGSEAYKRLQNDVALTQTRAMRNKKAP